MNKKMRNIKQLRHVVHRMNKCKPNNCELPLSNNLKQQPNDKAFGYIGTFFLPTLIGSSIGGMLVMVIVKNLH